MADFRRAVTALAVVVLLMGFASTASAQVQPFTCNASAAVPPLLRAEGLTELTGDIVLTCSGGTQVAAGTATPLANFTIFLGNTNVTSRLLPVTGVSNASEAVLLIDEPGTPGAAAFTNPAPPTTGCPVISNVLCPAGNAGVPNVYQGLVSGNSVTFIGVPVNPPGTTIGGVYTPGQRIFRITNIRANASAVGAGPAGTPGQVQAFISITGPTSVPINNPTQVVGFVQTGLTVSDILRNAGDTGNISSGGAAFAQCQDISRGTQRARLRFRENFATAFKVRGTTTQNVPGAIYNTESGLVIPLPGGGFLGGGTFVTNTAGLADFGTRLRATFANIPAGLNVWVSTASVTAAGNAPQPTSGSFAALTSLTQEGSLAGFSQIPGTQTEAGNQIVQVPISGGTGVAVWEVLNSSPLLQENFDFMIHFQATANVANNVPGVGVGTVSISFAPAPPAITATAGASASATLPIPRFVDSGVTRNLVNIFACRTNLLFPFVTNQAGFDTGLAIANTSRDPFGTAAQSGTCTWNFFGDNAPAASTSGAVAGGTVLVNLASSAAPNFQGYVIAVCQFQFGHGFAFVSDLGARNLAMGYLALVLPDPARQATALTLAGSGIGELLGQ